MSALEPIRIRGARQHNLQGVDLDLPAGELIVVTGVSGSGKSSLVFDTVYAEGQRRYVETFSAYARQFLERMDRPQVDQLTGVPPAIAIDQVNPVRTSRSTVGTMTELTDHLKLLFARAARLHCHRCGAVVEPATPERIADALFAAGVGDGRGVAITFPVHVPAELAPEAVRELLSTQGYTRIFEPPSGGVEVVQDRLRLEPQRRPRLLEALETALVQGGGEVRIWPLDEQREPSGSALRYTRDRRCGACDIAYSQPRPDLFSSNSPVGACPHCRGFGRTMEIDPDLVVPDPARSLEDGAIRPFRSGLSAACQDDLLQAAAARGVPTDRPWHELSEAERAWVWEGEPRRRGSGRWYGVQGYFAQLERKSYKTHVRMQLSRYRAYRPCKVCRGARLVPAALDFRIGTRALADAVLPPEQRFRPGHVELAEAAWQQLPGLTLHDLACLPLHRLQRFFEQLQLPAPFAEAAATLLEEIRARLGYLNEVGLGYLTLDRQSRTLSGGEVQRINLTTALGTSLVQTLFVLDEPSVGLHPRDVERLIGILRRLRDAGNSLLLVEHDAQVMLAADRLIDMGLGPGERGGTVLFNGPPQALSQARSQGDGASVTAAYLGGERRVARPVPAQPPGERALRLSGAHAHNLQAVDVEIPLNRLVCLTGVSGSGKSTLAVTVLYRALLRHFGRATEPPGVHAALEGIAQLRDVVLVDQAPIGKSARSCPVSYSGALEPIRKRFAATPLARERGYGPGTFSFNAGTGRCPTCQGSGFEHVEMQFLADVYLPCPDCDGRRFRAEVLEVVLEGGDGQLASIHDVLQMTVDAAVAFFADLPAVAARLEPLQAVGLGYLRLGQPVPTLSGGEAQRLKLAGHLAESYGATQAAARKAAAGSVRSAAPVGSAEEEGTPIAANGGDEQASGGTLFILDEPTTGLHFADVQVLLNALQRLLDAGNSLLVVEHNLDVIANADWLIDLGPEGGEQGGKVVATGSPQQLAAAAATATGWALAAAERGFQGAPAPTTVPDSAVAEARGPYSAVASDSAANNAAAATNGAGTAAPVPAAADRLAVEAGVESDAPRSAPASSAPGTAPDRPTTPPVIDIRQAREHNLQAIDVAIPRHAFSVISGVSGSGKSTLAFDIVFGEGQRRYLESLNAYARQLVQPAARPDVGAISGIPPSVAIEQRVSRGGYLSTVATVTEIYHYVRLLYLRLGVQYCPCCDVPITARSEETIAAELLSQWRGERVELLAPLVIARKGSYKELAKWVATRGYRWLRVDGQRLPSAPWTPLDRYREHHIDLPIAELEVAPEHEAALRSAIERAVAYGEGTVRVAVVAGGKQAGSSTGDPEGSEGGGTEGSKPSDGAEPISRVEPAAPPDPAEPTGRAEQVFSTRRACPECGRGFAEPDPRLFSFNSSRGCCPQCRGFGVLRTDTTESAEAAETAAAAAGGEAPTCPACNGTRLNEQARAVRLHGQSITEISALSVQAAREWAATATERLNAREQAIASDLFVEIERRLAFLEQVGLGYLTLDRAAPTLSGGEAQRIRLAASLGTGLQGVCYVLDEPTIGLHARDNAKLLETLRALAAAGNTVVVVEHDEETIRAAEHVIDLGPGAGRNGGRVVVEGSVATLMACSESLTGQLLRDPPRPPSSPRRPVASKMASEVTSETANQSAGKTTGGQQWLRVIGADRHNLQGIDVELPLGRLICISGVSGSGKSTLVREVLEPSVRQRLTQRRGSERVSAVGCRRIAGLDPIERLLEVDQTPIGRTPRSCPATYVGIWDEIRKLFAATEQARMRGWGAARFSFNVAGGRCEACSGQGVQRIEMNFLPDVEVTCEVCGGRRFGEETRQVRYAGCSIDEVLAMSAEQACEFFTAHSAIRHPLELFCSVGLGYLSLGQPSPTLSGGEAQRLKLVTELAKARPARSGRTQRLRPTLYLLDEPTVGLHMADVLRLTETLHTLVAQGHSVVVIEHNLDVIAQADWVIDLGPEGGEAGGRLIAAGPPAMIAAAGTPTGTALAKLLQARGG
ncbi:excinuclease ABC subunit UvrA [Halorhodospira abdelmalekii]|uniref:excinuclease ABC subunit UvrA n=1 Tax=Halorhodospira abdelmalekii TaxID=421629 RepID=UPI001F5BB14E|nr:excinuclease ABC subunit UvrA [Halorhodospira abdelmalekii]